jgi:hypothetical protein
LKYLRLRSFPEARGLDRFLNRLGLEGQPLYCW